MCIMTVQLRYAAANTVPSELGMKQTALYLKGLTGQFDRHLIICEKASVCILMCMMTVPLKCAAANNVPCDPGMKQTAVQGEECPGN